MTADAVITIHVDRRDVREAVLDLRCQTVIALAACRTILERMDLAAPELAPPAASPSA
jgi:hypothetical protein